MTANRMPTPADMTARIAPIIAQYYPDETDAFEMAGGDVMASAYAGKPARSDATHAEFGWVDRVAGALEFIVLIHGAVAAAREIAKLFSTGKPDKPMLLRIWTERLVEAGVDPEKARLVAADLAKDASLFEK